MTRRRGALACASGLVVIALGAGVIAFIGRPVSTGNVSRDTESMLATFFGVILIAGGIRLIVGSERLHDLLKPLRNRRRLTATGIRRPALVEGLTSVGPGPPQTARADVSLPADRSHRI